MAKSAEAFRTISEVADWLEVPTHVLRFWESKFPQVKPVKRAGGRRYYRPADMSLLAGIRVLLHDDGITIRGVQKILREQGVKHVAGLCDRRLDGAEETVQPVEEDAQAAEDTAEAKVVDLVASTAEMPADDDAAEPPAEAAPEAAPTEDPLPLFTARHGAPDPDAAEAAPSEAPAVPDPAPTAAPGAAVPALPGPSPQRSDALGAFARRLAAHPGALSQVDPDTARVLADRLAALRARIDGSDPA
ncbi:MerR family transcriptional regulator [Dinoroseobacter sp. PD6]|uniref:MerR family transcriptional regulator n=1 Tax=Dinoroseobacter sp. PD6 TaxID=3028384 RepID=UPI00237A3B4B|nr:MerR family transcriptional regulator [Dinoroseobacter sp. PD6]MDD9715441.1 MerR family transcriptional regulator [Dinoroseobacter sp. PD6]